MKPGSGALTPMSSDFLRWNATTNSTQQATQTCADRFVPENAVRIALEFVDRHVDRFGFLGVGRRRDVRLGSPAGFLIELAD
jgi:hypothetical protein